MQSRENSEYRLRVIAEHVEYNIISFNETDMKAHDIVFRAILFEICKFYKDYNILLKLNKHTDIEIYEVIQMKVPLVYVVSKDPNNIKTKMDKEERMVVKQLVIIGSSVKMTIRAKGKLPQEVDCKVSDIQKNLSQKGFNVLMKKPKKIGRERRSRLITIIKNIPGPKSVLKQVEYIGNKGDESIYDMMDEEREMIQYGIETARRMEKEKKEKEKELILKKKEDEKNKKKKIPKKPVIKEMENTRTDKIFSEENLTDREIDMYELGKHFTKHDAWTAINGSVFDITGFVSEHPGGAVLLKAAGKDGTSLFNQYHNYINPHDYLKDHFIGHLRL